MRIVAASIAIINRSTGRCENALWVLRKPTRKRGVHIHARRGEQNTERDIGDSCGVLSPMNSKEFLKSPGSWHTMPYPQGFGRFPSAAFWAHGVRLHPTWTELLWCLGQYQIQYSYLQLVVKLTGNSVDQTNLVHLVSPEQRSDQHVIHAISGDWSLIGRSAQYKSSGFVIPPTPPWIFRTNYSCKFWRVCRFLI